MKHYPYFSELRLCVCVCEGGGLSCSHRSASSDCEKRCVMNYFSSAHRRLFSSEDGNVSVMSAKKEDHFSPGSFQQVAQLRASMREETY